MQRLVEAGTLGSLAGLGGSGKQSADISRRPVHFTLVVFDTDCLANQSVVGGGYGHRSGAEVGLVAHHGIGRIGLYRSFHHHGACFIVGSAGIA